MSLTPRETVVGLLETYRDVILDGHGEGITSRADSRLLALSKMFHEGSYKELEKSLALMRNRGSQEAVRDPLTGKGIPVRTLYWHLMEWYVRAEKVRRLVPRQTKKHGKTVNLRGADGRVVTIPRIVTVRHKDVREHKVRLAVDWLVNRWDEANPTGRRPQLPKELWEVMAA